MRGAGTLVDSLFGPLMGSQPFVRLPRIATEGMLVKKQSKTRRRKSPPGSLAAVMTAVVAASCAGPAVESPSDAGSATRPLIGITSTIKDESAASPLDYARAVEEAGGLPVILPPIDDDALRAQYVRRLDGLVLSGGPDVPPAAYGEKPHKTVKPMPAARWESESKLIEAWLASGKPVLGICLGAQVINVVRGGSLIQDLPSQIGGAVAHAGRPDKEDSGGARGPRTAAGKTKSATHRVAIAADSRLHAIFGRDEITVASSHHQAVKRLGRGLRATAHSDDGLIEAIELPKHPWALFVQWHPERMNRKHRDVLFGAFIREAAGSGQRAGGSRPLAE